MFELFCLVNNLIIWEQKKKKKKERERKNTSDGRIRPRDLWRTKPTPYHRATDTNYCNRQCYKIYIYIQYGVLDHTTFDLRNPTIPILI